METVTTPLIPAPVARPAAVEARPIAWARRNACTVTAAGLYGVVLGVSIAAQFVQDSWLSLAGGRDIAQNGLPWQERLTALSAGETWSDQQWLGKLFLYSLSSLGGLRLVALAHLLLVLAAAFAALAVARRRGASDSSVLWVAIAFLPSAPWGWQLRTQTLAYVLFVAVLATVTSRRLSPLLKVLACAPILVVWANVHGSVTLGASLVFCAAFPVLRHALLRRSHPRELLLAGTAVALPVACLFASPYGFHLARYYRTLLGNPLMSRYIQEWQAPTARSAGVFFVLAGVVIWLVARHGRTLSAMERVALLVTGATGLMTIRGIVWFWFAALLIVPKLLDARSTRTPARRVPNSRLLTAVAALWACAALASVAIPLVHLPQALDRTYPRSAARTVEAAAARSPGLKIFASERYADWLLWNDPSLAGRLVYDARFELFHPQQFAQLSEFRAQGPGKDEITKGAGLFVLGFRGDGSAIRNLSREQGSKILFRNDELVVLLRTSRI